MIGAVWRDPERLSDRARSWLVFGVVVCATLIFLSIWVTYAATHVYERFEQQPAGSSVTVAGNTYRLISLTRTDEVVDGGESKPSSAHATWVIAELELTIPRKKDTIGCDLRLLADGKRQWDSQTFYSRKLPNYCGDSDHPITPGQPWRFEQIYEVPTKFADQIEGVAVTDHSSAAPMKVLRPLR
jgi:hypothetical protein